MSINRYRLKHLTKKKHKGAIKASALLKRPDRLIGLILLGNNFVNILASSLSTIIALRLIETYDLHITEEVMIGLAAGILTFVILIFAEVTPKTLSALHPERIAFPAAFIYTPLLKLFYPIVYFVNFLANNLLKLLRVRTDNNNNNNPQALSLDELKTVVLEAGSLIPERHQTMLLSILSLEAARVEDIMVPRNEIVGIDLAEDQDSIIKQLVSSQYTRLLAFTDNIENIQGIIHTRKTLNAILNEKFKEEELSNIVRQPYYVPEGTPLTVQLINFQHERRRTGIVVDEYGDIQGLVTLEDILEEIVGDFTTLPTPVQQVRTTDDGSVIIDGSTHVRDINQSLMINLPVDGPKTLNGLILEYLEDIPDAGTSLKLEGHPVEIMQMHGNMIKTVKFYDIP